MNEEFKVKIKDFQGPLELLLFLVEKRKMPINDISLSIVFEDYINWLNNQGKLPMDRITSFLQTASILILIKSKSLLPGIELSEDEERQVGDLERRLLIYKIFKDKQDEVSEKFGKNISYTRPKAKIFDRVVFSPDKNVNKETLFSAINDIFSEMPDIQKLTEVSVEKVIKIEEVIENMIEKINSMKNLSFKNISGGSKNVFKDQREKKVYAIVSFLALLELARRGIIDIAQKSFEEDISIFKKSDKDISRQSWQ